MRVLLINRRFINNVIFIIFFIASSNNHEKELTKHSTFRIQNKLRRVWTSVEFTVKLKLRIFYQVRTNFILEFNRTLQIRAPVLGSKLRDIFNRVGDIYCRSRKMESVLRTL